jgi:hypothetical protein
VAAGEGAMNSVAHMGNRFVLGELGSHYVAEWLVPMVVEEKARRRVHSVVPGLVQGFS